MKKDIKRQRIEKYFLESTRDIIITEGYEHVTVRKVADLAGYSYATIYNYYTDLNELLWNTREAMIQETMDNLMVRMQGIETDTDGIKRIFGIYIEYYFKNPNIFKFFYFCRLNKPEKQEKKLVSELNFEDIWKRTFMGFVLNGSIKEADIETIAKTIIYAVHGMIALYLSNVGEMTEESTYKDLGKLIDYLLFKK